MTSAMKRGDLVMCEWDDACSHDEWTPEREVAALDVVASKTAGFLVDRNTKRVLIAGTYNAHGDWCQMIAIPAGMIRRLRKVNT